MTGTNLIRRFTHAMVATAALVLLLTPQAPADTLTLTDGTVYDGEVTREVDGWIYFRYTVAGIERNELFSPDRIKSLKTDEPVVRADATPAKAPEARDAPKAKPRAHAGSDVPRIAIISLGEPDKHMVGMYMTAHSVRQTIPMLEKAGVTDVVFRVHSGGGFGLEVQKMSDLIHEEFKPKFRVVAWIDMAISAAAMSAHCMEEIYFAPQGTYGACTGWFGQLKAVEGRALDGMLYQMEKISSRGGHDYRLMRAMQIMEPLSASVDDNGDVEFSQDLSGDVIINPEQRILTLNATLANEIGFSGGTAATVDELAKLMGYNEYEFVGKDMEGVPYPVSAADAFLYDFRERVAVDERRTQQYFLVWEQSLGMARGAGENRGRFVGKARNALKKIEGMVRNNPNVGFFVLGLPDQEAFEDWLDEQEEMLRDLAPGR